MQKHFWNPFVIYCSSLWKVAALFITFFPFECWWKKWKKTLCFWTLRKISIQKPFKTSIQSTDLCLFLILLDRLSSRSDTMWKYVCGNTAITLDLYFDFDFNFSGMNDIFLFVLLKRTLRWTSMIRSYNWKTLAYTAWKGIGHKMF